MSSMLRGLSVRTNFTTRTISTALPPYSPRRPPPYALNEHAQFILEEPTRPPSQTYLTPVIFFRALAAILALASVAVGAAIAATVTDDSDNQPGSSPAVFGILALEIGFSGIETSRLSSRRRQIKPTEPRFVQLGGIVFLDVAVAIALLLVPALTVLTKYGKSLLVGIHVGLALACGFVHFGLSLSGCWNIFGPKPG